MVIVLRSSEGWPDTYVPHLREAVAAVDPTVPLFDVRTMERIVLNLTATRRFYLRLILLLAATGLGLAMLGIYGVVAYFVAERTPEIGLRMAIGARRSEVIGMVIGQGLRLVAAGVAIGLPVAMLVSYSIRTLFLVPPADPLTFASVAVVLAATGLTASVVPSVKAARVDPVDAIRYE
jgi:putative ABC transport system permease protein